MKPATRTRPAPLPKPISMGSPLPALAEVLKPGAGGGPVALGLGLLLSGQACGEEGRRGWSSDRELA